MAGGYAGTGGILKSTIIKINWREAEEGEIGAEIGEGELQCSGKLH
jgi:hypothetical protein